MYNTLKDEFIKVYKNKQIYISIFIGVLISMVFLLIGKKDNSFIVPLNNFTNMNNLYIYVILLTLSAYIMGIEFDYKTIKILKCKPISAFKLIFSKLIMAILYAAIIFVIPCIICSLVGMIFLPRENIELIGANNENIVILASEGLVFVIKAYAFQFIASIFVVSLSLFLTILSNSYVISVIGTVLVIMVINLIGQMKFLGLDFLKYIIPTNVNNIFPYLFSETELRNKLILFLAYSLIFFIASIIVYRKKEVHL